VALRRGGGFHPAGGAAEPSVSVINDNRLRANDRGKTKPQSTECNQYTRHDELLLYTGYLRIASVNYIQFVILRRFIASRRATLAEGAQANSQACA
jgi:hypothetical protein